jgi:hypothetical protein
MQHLPLQVRKIDIVRVDQAERADPGGRELQRGRRTKTARANAKHARFFDPVLSVHPDFGHNQVP